MEDIKKELALLQKQVDLIEKSNSLEFQNISNAFQRFGELTELVYLELTTLLDLLDSKKLINQEEFAKQLELTGDAIRSEAMERIKAGKNENTGETQEEPTSK